MMPSSASSGVREPPVPVVLGVVLTVRSTLASCGERSPYARIGAPGVFIDAGTSGGAARAVSSVAPASAAAPPCKNNRRWSRPLPATGSSESSDCRFVMRSILLLPGRNSRRRPDALDLDDRLDVLGAVVVNLARGMQHVAAGRQRRRAIRIELRPL